MKLKGERVVVSGNDFIKISRLTSDFADMDQVENFWVHNITAETAKVLASHFKDHNPQRVIVEDCTVEVCKIIFTPRNFARSETLDLINLSPDAACRTAAVLPFTRIGGLVLEVLSPAAIDRIGSLLPISKIEEVWLDRLTPEAALRAIDILSKTEVTEITLENTTEETAVKLGSIRLRSSQTITILPENAGNAFLSAREKRIPEALAVKPEPPRAQTQKAKVSTPANDQQSLITNLTEQNVYLQSVIDRQFALLKQQQEFMKAELPGAARMPFFQDPEKGSKKRAVAEADPKPIPPTRGSHKQLKK